MNLIKTNPILYKEGKNLGIYLFENRSFNDHYHHHHHHHLKMLDTRLLYEIRLIKTKKKIDRSLYEENSPYHLAT